MPTQRPDPRASPPPPPLHTARPHRSLAVPPRPRSAPPRRRATAWSCWPAPRRSTGATSVSGARPGAGRAVRRPRDHRREGPPTLESCRGTASALLLCQPPRHLILARPPLPCPAPADMVEPNLVAASGDEVFVEMLTHHAGADGPPLCVADFTPGSCRRRLGVPSERPAPAPPPCYCSGDDYDKMIKV